MRLTELNPRWFSYYGSEEKRLGITFDCPHCRTERIGVPFHKDGQQAMDDAIIKAHDHDAKIWDCHGDDFSNLTLSPSIDASKSGHWHGFITNGNIQ